MSDGFSTPEVEQALISALMQWPDKGFPVCHLNSISMESFSDARHRYLFNALLHLWSSGKPIDRAVIVALLGESKQLDAVGGELYLNETRYECCHASEMIPYYVELLLERVARRGLRQACVETFKEAKSPVPVEDLLAEHENKIASIPHGAVEPESMESILDRIFDEPDKDVVKTKITKLDEISPFGHCNMTLISGMRKAGKTALALTIATNVARQGVPVVYYSLEDHGTELSKRIITGLAGVPFSPRHSDKLVAARNQLKQLPIQIIDSVQSLSAICASIAQLSQQKKAGLVIVDYAQLVKAESLKENREQQVSEVSRTFRQTCMKWRVPMLLLCQLNEDGRTRESRALEQDCTAMWLLERIEDEPNVMSLSVPFQRNGPSQQMFRVTFRGEVSRIENYQANTDE
jgi:replicative DNA helicase